MLDNIFQSTLPRGERRIVCGYSFVVSSDFNPRSREGSDDFAQNAIWQIIEFQSTLPRGERRDHARLAILIVYISIHAPARGATGVTTSQQMLESISIHAPARGATEIFGSRWHKFEYFNPRSREGSDLNNAHFVSSSKISIHAPARGATRFCRLFCYALQISIHAPARGATSTDSVY